MSEFRPEQRWLRVAKGARLRSSTEFQAVYETRVRRRAGPLLVYARPNGLKHSRLGLAVSRKAGGAVTRNRIKRCLREAFRLSQQSLPQGYDFVISVRPHDLMKMQEYQQLLAKAAEALVKAWRRT